MPRTGVINWFEWEGERTEGNLEITIDEDPEEYTIKGVLVPGVVQRGRPQGQPAGAGSRRE
jgi:hypothetical protein